MFKLQQESFMDNVYQLEPLFDIHYQEISRHFKQGIPLDPDYDRYAEFEKAGVSEFVTLRWEGALVGYYHGILNRSLHYKSLIQLTTDLIFVSPQYRGLRHGMNGGDLLIEKALEIGMLRDCGLVACNFKFARAKHMQNLLERHRFEPFDAHYVHWF